MPGKLDDRVAIVTGGGMGLGESTADLFAREGAKVVIADINVDAGEKVVTTLRDGGSEALFVKANVAVAADAKNVVEEAIRHFSRVDILINNAGVQVEKAVPETTEEDWDFVLGVNLKGAFLCSKYAIRQMRKQQSGNIVCISSLSGIVSNPNQASYNASQARSDRPGQMHGPGSCQGGNPRECRLPGFDGHPHESGNTRRTTCALSKGKPTPEVRPPG